MTDEKAILVADDDPAVRKLLRLMLEEGGFPVLEASDGREVLPLCRTGRPALLIIDLVMPEQEGIETIQMVRREFPDLRIIAISGAFNGKYLKVAEVLGAYATLQKPLSQETVLSAVRSALS